ncbi:hypothetical protein [Sphingopyxis sp. Geo48]|uniref:hypothetical protein n=1 Tax=Sphingopyxis sp. Geo48 TaxID=545241 RepID=UPI0024B65767|nr:hypothetical protein [Sphingopyxis sp. Geo48]
MPLYLATYDLVKEQDGHDYKPLTDALKELDGVRTQWSAWLLDLSSTKAKIYRYLAQFIDENDRLMIIEIESKPVWGKAFQGTKDMIDRYFP